MTTNTPVLSISDAHKSYGRAPALRGVTLDLYPGELVGFLGPNGAGKTTLIRCLAGRLALDEGTIRFAKQLNPRESLGVVPQSIAVYEDLSAEQNLLAFGRLQGVTGAELKSRAEAALRWSNLTDRRHALVKTFSGGMQRRLNIACSVLHRPRVLLLDEPTVGVDPQSRECIYEMLAGLRKHGTSILLTTHQLEEAQTRCDRIAIVDQGKVIQVGTFDELVTSTVGRQQRLQVSLQRPARDQIASVQLDETGRIGSCTVSEAADELPGILQQIQDGGNALDRIILQGPTLQDVFLHLTGRELRE